MDNELLLFESELDEKAVDYMLAVLENPNSDKAISIANEILNIVLEEDLRVLKIEKHLLLKIAFIVIGTLLLGILLDKLGSPFK
jgi:hypothetical protein